MKKFMSALLSVFVLIPSIAFSQEAQVKLDEQLPPVVFPLTRGQTAPYSGVLFSQSASATVVADHKTLQERIDLAVRNALEVATTQRDYDIRAQKIKFDADIAVKDASIEASAAKLKRFEDDLRAAEKRASDAESIASSRPMWAGIGVAAGVVLSVVSAFAIT